MNDHRAKNARQNVRQDDTRIAKAGDSGGGDVEFLADAEHHAAHDARHTGRAKNAERDHGCRHRLAEDTQYGQQHHNDGDGLKEADILYDDAIPPTAEIAGAEAEQHADQADDRQRLNDADEARGRAVQQAAQDITSERVGAEQMLHARQLLDREQILIERVIARDLTGEQSANNDDCDPDQGKERKRTTKQPGEEAGGLR